jgi:hypothetical protein
VNWFQRNILRQLETSKAETAKPSTRARIGAVGTGISGGRLSVDNESSYLQTSLSVLAPISGDETWRNFKLDSRTLDRITPTKLIELLADVSPDVSRALWDFLLFTNPGWEVKAYKLDSEDAIDKRAQEAVDTFLRSLHGPFTLANTLPCDVIFASMFMGVFMRGAFFVELVLDEAGRMPLEIATPDPSSVRFLPKVDPVRKQVWQIAQYQEGVLVPMDRPTIVYVPLHPFPGKPNGRAIAAPAMFSTLFLIGMLHDLRRVVTQQGWPRMDIEVDFEAIKDSMPSDAMGDPVKFKEWVDGVIGDVQSVFSDLEPDDTYIHASTVKVNTPKGTVDTSSLGKVDDIIRMLERMTVRALKSMPLLFGINEATSETHANRQWEIHVAGIKSIQHLAENVLEHLLGIALQVQGIQARVEFRFAELRAAELLRDQQVELLKSQVARAKYDNGWISQDEAAQIGAGKDKADQPEPRAKMATVAPTAQTANADPGSNRSILDLNDSQRLEM